MVERGLDQFLNEAQEYLDAGDINNSLQTANKAHVIARDRDDADAIARALNIISLCYFVLGNKKQSLIKAREAMAAARKAQSSRQIAFAHYSLAKGYFLNNQTDQAEVEVNDGLVLARRYHFKDLEEIMLRLLKDLVSQPELDSIDTESDKDE